MNKITKEAKTGISIRAKTAIFIGLYLILTFVFQALCSPLGSTHYGGWFPYFPNDKPWIELIFAILFILSFAWFSYFIAKELCGCFLKSNKRSTVIGLTVLLLILQLLPTACYLPYVYYPTHNYFSSWWALILIYMLTSLGTALIAYVFLYKAIKHTTGATKFHIIMFPLIVIGIAWSFSCLYYLTIEHEWSTVFLMLVGVCACDVFAFFGGTLFGKHKLAPRISPKKTWEGAIIGTIIAVLLVVLIVYLMGINDANQVHSHRLLPGHRYLFFGSQTGRFASQDLVWDTLVVIMAFAIAIAGSFGDLLFSLIKRKTNIKDFGTLLPGHGGILDRMDAFLFTLFSFGALNITVSVIASIVHKQDTLFCLTGVLWQ